VIATRVVLRASRPGSLDGERAPRAPARRVRRQPRRLGLEQIPLYQFPRLTANCPLEDALGSSSN